MNLVTLPTGNCSRFAALGLVMLVVAGCQRAEPLGPVADASSVERIRDAFGASDGLGDASTATAKSSGTGWGTLRGRFIFEGSPPKMPPYGVNRDQATCSPGGVSPLQQTLLVDSASGGLANVAIYVRKVSRVHESAQPKSDSVPFDQKSCVFLSHVFPLTLGQTMEIKNSDNVGHNTKIEGKNGFNQTIPAGESIDFKPQKEEAVPKAVGCSIHPWMLAYYLPRKNAYYSVSAPDGSFEIANLPAGEDLEIQVWHESGTGPGGALVLSTPEASALKWSKKGRFKLKLQPDEVRPIDIIVPAAALGG